jgi:glycine dehydrogenase subunit 2
MLEIAADAARDVELLKTAPHHRPVQRLDEVRAAKQPIVKYGFEDHPSPQAPREPVAAEAPKGV